MVYYNSQKVILYSHYHNFNDYSKYKRGPGGPRPDEDENQVLCCF